MPFYSGYDNTSIVIKDLLNYWKYQITVTPRTQIDPAAVANVTIETTKATGMLFSFYFVFMMLHNTICSTPIF